MYTLKLQQAKEWLRPRNPLAHKGDYGTLTVLCGSRSYRGAAALCVESALRAGAGIVRLASLECVIEAVAPRSPEAIFFPMREEDGAISSTIEPLLLQKSNAVLCGCGCPKGPQTLQIAQKLLKTELPLVLDAGALTSLAQVDGVSALRRQSPCIITPHVGEMATLCHTNIESVSADLESYAHTFSKTYGCITVLKSHRTVIATPQGELWESRLAHPGLARGGSGDVLAGAIASFLTQGYSAQLSALLGVWLHATASVELARVRGPYAMLPRELPDFFSGAFSGLS